MLELPPLLLPFLPGLLEGLRLELQCKDCMVRQASSASSRWSSFRGCWFKEGGGLG